MKDFKIILKNFLDKSEKMLFDITYKYYKESFDINSNYLSYKEGHHTLRNKGDLDSVIKAKTSILAL